MRAAVAALFIGALFVLSGCQYLFGMGIPPGPAVFPGESFDPGDFGSFDPNEPAFSMPPPQVTYTSGSARVTVDGVPATLDKLNGTAATYEDFGTEVTWTDGKGCSSGSGPAVPLRAAGRRVSRRSTGSATASTGRPRIPRAARSRSRNRTRRGSPVRPRARACAGWTRCRSRRSCRADRGRAGVRRGHRVPGGALAASARRAPRPHPRSAAEASLAPLPRHVCAPRISVAAPAAGGQISTHGSWVTTSARSADQGVGSTLSGGPRPARNASNRGGATPGPIPGISVQNDNPWTVPTGSRSQRRIMGRPSGRAERSIARCASTRRRFVRPAAIISQADTVTGSHPRFSATSRARRRLRSNVPTSSFISARSVLSSITRRVAGPGARRGCR